MGSAFFCYLLFIIILLKLEGLGIKKNILIFIENPYLILKVNDRFNMKYPKKNIQNREFVKVISLLSVFISLMMYLKIGMVINVDDTKCCGSLFANDPMTLIHYW